jgi:glutathione S-transferase
VILAPRSQPVTDSVLVVSIPVSPYVEVARWLLDILGIAYHEQCHAPFLHLPASFRQRGGTDVPVLSAPGVSLANARAVLEHYGCYGPPERRLYPEAPEDRAEVERLVTLFYDDMGVAVRAWAYSHMLPEREVTARLWARGAPAFERFVVRWAYPVLAAWMRRALRITPRTPEQAVVEIDTALDQVEVLLSDGRRYLAADRFTAADLVFAALLGPAVLPDNYGGPLPAPFELPAQMRRDHERFRNREAGAYALRLYREDR